MTILAGFLMAVFMALAIMVAIAWAIKNDNEDATLGPDILCECGNTNKDDGFFPSTKTGWVVDPTGEWYGHFVCGRCGRVFTVEGTEAASSPRQSTRV